MSPRVLVGVLVASGGVSARAWGVGLSLSGQARSVAAQAEADALVTDDGAAAADFELFERSVQAGALTKFATAFAAAEQRSELFSSRLIATGRAESRAGLSPRDPGAAGSNGASSFSVVFTIASSCVFHATGFARASISGLFGPGGEAFVRLEGPAGLVFDRRVTLDPFGGGGVLGDLDVDEAGFLDPGEWRLICEASSSSTSSLDKLAISVFSVDVQLSDAPPCPADLTGDHIVDSADLQLMLGQWGGGEFRSADLNGDGYIDSSDLSNLLGSWGPCPL